MRYVRREQRSNPPSAPVDAVAHAAARIAAQAGRLRTKPVDGMTCSLRRRTTLAFLLSLPRDSASTCATCVVANSHAYCRLARAPRRHADRSFPPHARRQPARPQVRHPPRPDHGRAAKQSRTEALHARAESRRAYTRNAAIIGTPYPFDAPLKGGNCRVCQFDRLRWTYRAKGTT